jgi:hypothetical protein
MWHRLAVLVAVGFFILGLSPELPHARGQGISTGPRSVFRLDKSRFPAARQAVLQSGGFPHLQDRFEVIDPTIGPRYNCIAHSLGIHSRWINPETGPAGTRLAPMDRLYREKGYTRAKKLDFALMPEVQKVALYAHVSNGQIREITHAAVQERTGTWTSKLGKLPLIRHTHPTALSGGTYGVPVAVYVKLRNNALTGVGARP